MAQPGSGDLLRVTRAASVQFVQPILFRVIRVHDWSTYDGWMWLDGYQLNAAGDAVARRSIFVRVGGLQVAQAWPFASTRRRRVARPASRESLSGHQSTSAVRMPKDQWVEY
jgi:hypothetical protein